MPLLCSVPDKYANTVFKLGQSIMLDLEYAPEPPYIGGTPDTTPKYLLEKIRKLYDDTFES